MTVSSLARINGSLHASCSRRVYAALPLTIYVALGLKRGAFRECEGSHVDVIRRSKSDVAKLGPHLPRRGRQQIVNAVNQEAATLKYDHLLLAIMDNNPYFSDGSKQAFATAATLATTHNSKVTVLLVDEAKPDGDQATRIETASWHLRENGFDPGNAAFQEVSLAAEESHNSSVVVGNAVDQVEADLVLLSTEAVHSKAVDANLLAEFVDCPVLLLP